MANKTLQKPTTPRDTRGPEPGRGGRGRGKPFPGGLKPEGLKNYTQIPHAKPPKPRGLVGFLDLNIDFFLGKFIFDWCFLKYFNSFLQHVSRSPARVRRFVRLIFTYFLYDYTFTYNSYLKNSNYESIQGMILPQAIHFCIRNVLCPHLFWSSITFWKLLKSPMIAWISI